MNKRGISNLVAIVLIILISLAAVVILWRGIIPLVSESLNINNLDVRLRVILDEGYTAYSSSNNQFSVQLLNEGENEIDFARIIVYSNNGDSYSEIVEAPERNNKKIYYYDWNLPGSPKLVSVSPFLESDLSKEGIATSPVEFSFGNINQVGLPSFGLEGPPVDNLVAHYKFDEGFGFTTMDSSGNGHMGILVGDVSWDTNTPSGSGRAIVLDGSWDYVDILVSSDFDLQDLSISAWVYSDNFARDMFIFEKGNVNTQYSLFFEINGGSNDIYFRNDNDANVQHDLVTPISAISNDNWHHIVATYDGEFKKIYIDGRLNVSSSYSQNIKEGLGGAERIGAYGGGSPNYFFNGLIDEVRIYNISIRAEDVDYLYNNP